MKNQYKIRSFVCIGCNKSIIKHTALAHTKYCSLECYRKSKRPNARKGKIIKCDNCGKSRYKYKSLLNVKNNFCDLKCANEYQGRNKSIHRCKICDKVFKWSPSRIKNGKYNPTYCSQKCLMQDTDFVNKRSMMGNKSQQNKQGPNRLELKGRQILEDLGLKNDIDFKEQQPMFNHFIVDILLSNYPIVIQWDGVYWHSKPRRKNLDISQDAYLKKCGYKVIRITDQQIKENIQSVYDIIKTTLVAAKQLNRKYIGCEMSSEYMEIINARLNIKENIDNKFFG